MPRWYHCIEVAPGVVTPGWFDLRPALERMPWPEVRGRRCLDVGTADGALAFELERRGAAEVVAVDLAAHDDWDLEPRVAEDVIRYLQLTTGASPRAGFQVAHRLLGSRVRFEALSVYELEPGRLGRFDVVVCGSLLLHLRDPLRALAAIASVCRGELLCSNQIDLLRSVGPRRRPLVRLDGTAGLTQWWIPNAAAHGQMLRAGGFTVVRESGLYSVPFGGAHPPRARTLRMAALSMTERVLTGHRGVPHVAALAVPAAPAWPATPAGGSVPAAPSGR